MTFLFIVGIGAICVGAWFWVDENKKKGNAIVAFVIGILILMIGCFTSPSNGSSKSSSGYDSALDRYINDPGFREYVNEQ